MARWGVYIVGSKAVLTNDLNCIDAPGIGPSGSGPPLRTASKQIAARVQGQTSTLSDPPVSSGRHLVANTYEGKQKHELQTCQTLPLTSGQLNGPGPCLPDAHLR